ncbi:FAD-binding oxidoreductase [Sphingorhabdus sp. Alg239-R122]|uniref:FAD-binding oxidoreductase n=1 Tax=Sphingorhabdus sp. Alg239-R122 TaxID=2305989 RepID=UPI0013D9EFA5|nr:FAD-binding oxidoreductase [Sphingorhabdus sp. Alg239-R122]
MASSHIIARGTDGYYHPENEDDVIALVKYAAENALQVRVRGAGHSVGWSIFTDPVDGRPQNMICETEPPVGPNINIALDQMYALDWIDEAGGIAEAEAGIHLGKVPDDPFGVSTQENSLLYQLYQKGWAINDLGGITHQTISGFTATGSAGGSLTYSLDNVIAFRVVDGTGNITWVEKGDAEFDAMSLSLGLLGIVTKVRLKLAPMYNIYGQEVTTSITKTDCPIDLFGPGDATQPSMRRFFEMTPYSRMMWWPQKKTERVVIWQAVRNPAAQPEAFMPAPYQEFTPDLGGQAEQLLASIFFTTLGNNSIFQEMPKIGRNFKQFRSNVAKLWSDKIGGFLASFLSWLITVVIGIIMMIPIIIFALFPSIIRALFPYALPIFQPMTKPGKPTMFQDYYWRSLCMDNTADDVMMGTEFTEIWIPIQHSERAMNLLNDMFDTAGSPATGYYATEVYGGAPSSAWLHPAYTDGSDEYCHGCVRFDVFWYRNNDSDPNLKHAFFQQYWNVFLDNNVPFRLHWGKFVPGYDFPFWARYYQDNLPKLANFLTLRAARDPHNIFFTEYWQLRLMGRTLS